MIDHIDILTKATLPIGAILFEDLNMTCDIVQFDSYGWLHNGTFNGAMGMFQRKRIKAMAHGTIMLKERLAVCEFTADLFKIEYMEI